MNSDIFDYDLDESLIAQKPSDKRDESRLLVVDRKTQSISHHTFKELPDLLPSNAKIFRNNASVFKARLQLTRPTGGKLECLFLHPGEDDCHWWCLLKPGKKMGIGKRFEIPNAFEAIVLDKDPSGNVLVQFKFHGSTSLVEILDKYGTLPLPPYISRETHSKDTQDLERYQTVYADPSQRIAAAAPTAGLHFTESLIENMKIQGFYFYDVLLRVGLGTFKPIKSESLEEHPMHKEQYFIESEVFQQALKTDAPRVAIGTTTVRTLEDAFLRFKGQDTSSPLTAEADIFIYPPRGFNVVDTLVTNFHLPKSTLLCLVSSFLAPESMDGIAWLKEIYAEAIANKYRFFSYGDAMLIL